MRVFTHWLTTVARDVVRHEVTNAPTSSGFLNAGPAQPGRPVLVRSDGRRVR